MGMKGSAPSNKFFLVRRQPTKVKAALAVVCGLVTLAAPKIFVQDHYDFFVVSEVIHFAGILVLIHKLTTQKTCSGLSLKTQELTAMFLAARLNWSWFMEGDIHTFLHFITLVSTLWVIYMMFKLKSPDIKDLDNIPLYFEAAPSAILTLFIHPSTQHAIIGRILWVLAVYLELDSILPQLRMIQNTKLIEPFTDHYVIALGIARFLGCANWIIKVYRHLVEGGYIWISMVLLLEVVLPVILALRNLANNWRKKKVESLPLLGQEMMTFIINGSRCDL